MRYRCLLLATLCLSFDRPCVFADVIASAGFNDAVGLNSNPQANSPYTLNATIQGKGLPEPGWSRPWQDNFPPQQSVVQSSFVFEGDGALALLPTALPSRAWNEQQFGIFSVKQRVMLTLGARLVAYTEVEATGEAISNQAAIWQAFPDQSIRVIDGTENSCDVCGDEITSFVWEPFKWYDVQLRIDMLARSYDFFVDGQQYIASDPLGFRGAPTYIDRIRYLSEGTGIVFIDDIRIVPELTSVYLLAMFACGLGTLRVTCLRYAGHRNHLGSS